MNQNEHYTEEDVDEKCEQRHTLNLARLVGFDGLTILDPFKITFITVNCELRKSKNTSNDASKSF